MLWAVKTAAQRVCPKAVQKDDLRVGSKADL